MDVLTSHFFSREKSVLRPTKLSLGIALLLCAPLAVAQNNLGELLDAGAMRLSVDEFKEEVVQRIITGPTQTGGKLEVIYGTNGVVQGNGSYLAHQDSTSQISGQWTIDDTGRICTSMGIGGTGTAGPGTGSIVYLPPRCQIWFKYAGQFFLSDSDSDRSARLIRRMFKQ